MSARSNAVIWIDHRQAKIFHVGLHDDAKIVIHAHQSVQRTHHAALHENGTAEPVDTEFFQRIAGALEHGGRTLISGPGRARLELEAYLAQHRPDLAPQLLAVDASASPDEAGLLLVAAVWLDGAH
jgi:stalled ribosome rescue protein Dom34